MLRLFWIISLPCIDSISPDCWQTMAPLAHLRANWLLFVKLPLYKRNNASILPQVLWMQPGRHTWAPWSLAIYRLWCTVQLFQFVSVGVFFFFFVLCLSKDEAPVRNKKRSSFDQWKVLPHFRLMAAHPSSPPPPHPTPTHLPFPPEDVKCLSLVFWVTLYDIHALMYLMLKDIALYPSALPTH